MEQSMRDLDRLQEQDPDDRGRHVGVWLVLAITLLALFGAVYVAWQRAKPTADATDPLDRLVPAAQKTRDAGSETKLDPSKLTFERALTGEEDRPEVIAALAAAKREEEELARGDNDDEADDDAPPA